MRVQARDNLCVMPLIYGLVLLALAISLAVLWWSAAFVAALEVLLVVALFLAGLVMALVGYSSTKAKRIVHHDTKEINGAEETGDAD